MSQQIDVIDALTLLEEYGIVVARSGYVDSAENALVFANRRPIVLYARRQQEHGYDPASAEPASDDHAVRAAYAKLSKTFQPPLFAQVEVERGSDITLAGEQRKESKILRFVSGAHTVEYALPLDERGAESMLEGFRSSRGLGSNERAVRMLAHLFIKVAKMYEDSGITKFTLHIRVHDNEYKVVDADMTTERMPEIKARAGHHALDRKSYDYHPSGRQ